MIGGPDMLWGGVVPAVVAAAALATVWRSTGMAASAWRTALLVGFVAGYWALDVRTIGVVATLAKNYRPTEARDWLPLLMLLAIVPDALACVGKQGPVFGWLLRGALCLFVPWRLLHGSVHLPIPLPGFDFDMGGWSTGEATAWIGGIGASLLIAWQLSRCATKQGDELLRSALAMVVGLGGAITVAMSASLVYGQLLGVLAAALAGCGLASAALRTQRGPDGAAGPLVIAFGSLLLVGHFFAELKIYNGALLLAAMALAVGWLPLPARLSPRWRAVCRCVVCTTALGLAITLAGFDFAVPAADTESNPYMGFQPQGQ